jgi:hypothetical protein
VSPLNRNHNHAEKTSAWFFRRHFGVQHVVALALSHSAGIAKTSSSAYKGASYNAGVASTAPAASSRDVEEVVSQA